MIISVTASDIRNSIPCNPEKCAVAKAANRTVPTRISVVLVGTIEFHKGDDNPLRYFLPQNVSDWIIAYDAGHACEPIVFELTEKILCK